MGATGLSRSEIESRAFFVTKRMNIMNRVVASLALVAVCGVAASAADTVNVKFNGTVRGQNVKITFAGNTSDVFAGQLSHTFSGGVGLGAKLNGTQITYCTDLAQFVATNTTLFNVVQVETMPTPAMGSAKANAIRDIYGWANGSQFNAATTTSNNEFAAAFQMAIWAIVYNYDSVTLGSISLTGPGVTIKNTNGTSITGSLLTAFNNIVANVGGGLRNGQEVFGVSNASFQDQLVIIPNPAPAMIAGAGVLGLVGIRRRR